MNQKTASLPTSAGLLRGAWLGALALAVTAAAGCNQDAKSPTSGTNSPGTVQSFSAGDPNATPSGKFLVDSNLGGEGQVLRLTAMRWGRMVDVYGLGAGGEQVLMHENFVITGNLESEAGDYLVELDPVTGRETLTILRYVDTQLEQFYSLLQDAERNLIPIFEAGLTGSGLFSMVPRNSALVIVFDDLLDQSTVSAETIRVLSGVPPTLPFEARIFIDNNHGDTRSGRFHSTRVIVDTTVSELESFEADPPLPVNGEGFPASINANDPNVAVRIASIADPSVGQEFVLMNATQHRMDTVSNGPVDFSSPTIDVVRGMRSGGKVTGDPYNGFLPDDTPPVIVGSLDTTIDQTPEPLPGDGTEFVIPRLTFAAAGCAQTPSVGDLVRQGELFAQVISQPTPQVGGVVFDLPVRLLEWPSEWDEPGEDGPLEWLNSAIGEAQFVSPYDPVDDAGNEACFVQVFPLPVGALETPTDGLSTNATLGLIFGEPMDPSSITAFDSLTLTRTVTPTSSWDYVVGRVVHSLDIREFTFVPDLPLAHESGTSTEYFLSLKEQGSLAATDLAGNTLTFDFPEVRATIDPLAETQVNGGRVTRFSSPDEEAPYGDERLGPLPEWSGQHVYDFTTQLIRPRPVIRYEAVADRTQFTPQVMLPVGLGTPTPVSPMGAKMQTLWRYFDVGLSLTDETNYNIDVEGISWSPLGGLVVVDQFADFEMRLSHSKWAPDESYVVINGVPIPLWPSSGLTKTFSNNLLDPNTDPQRTVHPGFLGYTINPGDKFVASTGTELIPFPLNQSVAPSSYQYFTWRDTGIQTRAADSNAGADPCSYLQANGEAVGCLVTPPGPIDSNGATLPRFFVAGDFQTIALPLLMEFRCFADGAAQGINLFDVSLAVPPVPGTAISTAPGMRAFSEGGTNQVGQDVIVDPDLQGQANGGFNPNSTPSSGASTPGVDTTFYIGALDLVTRVSRSYSVWYETVDGTGDTFFNAQFNPPVVEPQPSDQPIGTNVKLAFRGATSIDDGGITPPFDADDLENPGVQSLYLATALDSYGDQYDGYNPSEPDAFVAHDSSAANTAITFFGGDTHWHSNIADLDGARYYQIRATFISNAQTQLRPTLSSLAVSWQE